MEQERDITDSFWCRLVINEDKKVEFANELAREKLPFADFELGDVFKVLPWIRHGWLRSTPVHKIVKTSVEDRILLDIMPDPEKTGWYHLLFRDLDEYEDPGHLWCEVTDSVIGVQKFIDTSYDGIVVADGNGTFLAVNDAYVTICGLDRRELVGRNAAELVKEGIISYSCTLQTIDERGPASAVVKCHHGREVIVSSTPLFNSQGEIIRVMSNVRDISELRSLHEKLSSAKALATGYQRELIGMQAKLAPSYIHRSAAMDNLYDLLNKVAGTDLQLLITGESGVGKTMLAKYVHAQSDRSTTGNFIHVNCSAIPESLLESELFGHEEGSFTGAKKAKAGLFELANNGTIFLDEIGDMPLCLQAKILNVLQEEKFYRIGGTKEVSVDVRVIAATNQHLEDLIARGEFRQDLFYRLNVVPVRIPPLRERKEDLPPLIAYNLEKMGRRHQRGKSLSHDAFSALVQYDWPGNIRELVNVIERLVVVVDEPVIEERHLPNLDTTAPAGSGALPPRLEAAIEERKEEDTRLKTRVQRFEEEVISEAIVRCGSLKEASKDLGIDVSTLIRKRKRVMEAMSA